MTITLDEFTLCLKQLCGGFLQQQPLSVVSCHCYTNIDHSDVLIRIKAYQNILKRGKYNVFRRTNAN